MSEPFQYAVLRAVPRVERGECVNVGVLLYCQATDFLDLAVHVDESRLRALDPQIDLDGVRAALDGVREICTGTAAASGAGPGSGEGAGTAVAWSAGERFGWLTAPRSTVVQAGPVHSGVTDDAPRTLARLMTRLVR